MKLLLLARTTVLALSALAILAVSPAFAATPEVGTSNDYAKKNNEPTTQPVPNPGTGAQWGPVDLKLTYFSKVPANGGYQWTYTLENIGTGKALNVRMEKVAIRNGFNGSHAIETETSWENFGDLNSGATRTVVVTCVAKAGDPPCWGSSARAHLDNVDINTGNNGDTD